jgi:hypothetical protein
MAPLDPIVSGYNGAEYGKKTTDCMLTAPVAIIYCGSVDYDALFF